MSHLINQPTVFDFNSRKHREDLEFAEIARIARETLASSIPFKARHNCRYSNVDILYVLLNAALGKVCTENSSNLLNRCSKRKVPNADTVLRRIKSLTVDEVHELYLIKHNELFLKAKSKGAFHGKIDIAIDFTNQMHYGKKNNPMVVGTQPKNGSSFAYRYATASAVVKGERFFLAEVSVGPFSQTVKVVEKLLQHVSSTLDIGTICLDRGFFSVDVIAFLTQNNYNFLMPAVKNRRIKKLIQQVNPPEFMNYTMSSSGKNATFKLVFLKERKNKTRKNIDSKNKRKKASDNYDGTKVFATNLIIKSTKELDLFEIYAKRWGIETSYRMFNKFRPKTTSVEYVIRLFFFLFSTYLYNLWILVNIRIAFYYHLEPEKNWITSYIFLDTLKFLMRPGAEISSLFYRNYKYSL